MGATREAAEDNRDSCALRGASYIMNCQLKIKFVHFAAANARVEMFAGFRIFFVKALFFAAPACEHPKHDCQINLFEVSTRHDNLTLTVFMQFP